jgi:DNA-directed RNA polymerase specialized sigma24 family protein
MVALMAAERAERESDGDPRRKTEIILADAGLQPGEIAPLVGKNEPAVRKAIQRARKPARKKAAKR